METLQTLLADYNYTACILLMMIGFYGVIRCGNLVKKLMCLGIFQTSVLLLYISASYVKGAAAPILRLSETDVIYTNPLPHVLMLTAIVVGVATLAVGLAIAVRISEVYHSTEEADLLAEDNTPEDV